jgi:dihydroflavonol-4-reductase
MKRKILITGGTGFVGNALLRELDANGYELHALARATSDKRTLEDLEITWYPGDLTDAESLDRAVAAVCAAAGDAGAWLVHCAALISYRSADGEQQEAVNFGGTRSVLEAAERHGMQRVVHVSSVVGVGFARGDEVLDEDSTFNGNDVHCDYTRTKRAAEEFALSKAAALDLRVVNPGAIFGPVFGESNTTRFLRSVARRKLGPVAPPGGLSVLGVRDTARGIRLALERGRTGRRYLLVESYMTNAELFRLAQNKLGVPAVPFTMPSALWPLVVLGSRVVDAVKPASLATPQALRMLGLKFRYTSARAREELGWDPVPFDEVLDETIEHCRARGML